MAHAIFEKIHQTGILPVVEIDKAEHADPLAKALLAGGLPIVEVTFRTEAALDSIRRIARNLPSVIVGAGTVLNRKQAEAARDAGARFLVSPGMVEDVILWAQGQGLPMLAGAATPIEMIRGIKLGLSILKFFPAETMGGIKAIKAMSDPFPQLRFIPTGGLNMQNAAEYLQMEKIHAIGGSWMAKRQMIAERKFDEIIHLARDASRLVKTVRSNHP